MFEIFKIGFLSFNFTDLIDILLVSVLIYRIYVVVKGTIAAQIFFGLIIILGFSFLSQVANLKALSWLLQIVSDNWIIAFIILFQPEIRRFLVMLGRNPLLRAFVSRPDEQKTIADIIVDTAFELAQYQHGALIVLVKSSGIQAIVESGEIINAKVNKDLLRSIFFPRSPMHDGAVIIKNNIIEAAKCTLPLSNLNEVGGISLGMRHKAGLGITEQADVISVIVSEETGSISLAEKGKLVRGLSRDTLRNLLAFSLEVPKSKYSKNIFDLLKKRK
ncbi:MAG: TIGR00159 family protein [Melioribacteraceae bacterium]|nr:TIGR00159 family protein [Melioribacteraceae bacterium]